ncbi:4-hydroxy-3-methylbut-2-enyl diphosphate reductase [bacterium]|nr:4-hydroxy-3-methylbut-2-enyl diphosphate reductase [bacterium]
MEVRLAKNSGFCFGVKRAIKIAQDEAYRRKEKLVTIGPIIHNPQVVQRLEKIDVFSVNDLAEIKNTPAIIRSHGISKEAKLELKKKLIDVIDATCPYVSKLQSMGEKLSKEGYYIVVLGNKEHPEVLALISYLSGKYLVVEGPEEIIDLKAKKVALISQTTQTYEVFEKIVKKLLDTTFELHIVNTICSATTIRQDSTRLLAMDSNLMIIIGGKMSSNTKMLAKISQEYAETHHIETAKELDNAWFTNKNRIGISAGASTPDDLIIDVYNKIINISGSQLVVNSISEIPVFKEETR